MFFYIGNIGKLLKKMVPRFSVKAHGGRRDNIFEDRLRRLEEQVQNLSARTGRGWDGPEAPVVVEYLNIERLDIEKVELNNNFGSLGIKDLGGMLNIGANYGIGPPPREGAGKTRPAAPPDNKEKANREGKKGPACTIKFE